MKLIIRDNERGLLVRDGRIVEMLDPGRHVRRAWLSQVSVERIDLDHPVSIYRPEVAQVAPDEAVKELTVDAHEVGVLLIDGLAKSILRPGRYLLWQVRGEVEARVYDLSPLEPEIPQEMWDLLPPDLVHLDTVQPYERIVAYDAQAGASSGHVYAGGRLILSKVMRKLTVERWDLREQERTVVGQEVMTADKVSLRVSLIAKYRVMDPERAVDAVQNLDDALYSEVQMAARREVAGHRLDQLLDSRREASAAMLAQVKARAETWGIEVLSVDVKDIVLPGDMKALLNQVIEAEKQAAAQVILRREETAAVRSQSNTAKMLDASPTLRRLKELEAIKEIAMSIDQLTLVAGAGDIFDRIVTKQVGE